MSRRFIIPIESDVPNGTAPIIVDSSTLVANLNADLLDGQHGSYYAPVASPTFTGTVTAATLDLTTSSTTTAATSYWVETGSDGILRPKTLANTRTEIVTTAAVNAALATSLGTVTSGVWNAGAITTSSLITGNGGIAAEAWDKANITTRTQSGFIQTSGATTANGWPETTNSWYHLFSSTHSNVSNYYSLQLAAPFYSNKLYFRSTNGSGTTAWSQVATVDQLGSGGLDPFFLGGM
jgi:hypothetical protein